MPALRTCLARWRVRQAFRAELRGLRAAQEAPASEARRVACVDSGSLARLLRLRARARETG